MDQVSEDYGFTFIWKIHNYSYCIQKVNEYLESRKFLFNDCKWTVDLFPRGTKETPDDTVIRLWCEESKIPFKIHLVFSISTGEGPFNETGVLVYPLSTDQKDIKQFLNVPVINKRENTYGSNDTLTVKCKIVKVNDVPLNYKKICSAYTAIDVTKTTYYWDVNTFYGESEKKIDTNELNLFDDACFKINVSSFKGNSAEENFKIEIKQARANENLFSSFILTLLDANKVLQSIRNEHWFLKSQIEQVWFVSFTPTRKPISFPQQFKFLHFEFAISKGVGLNRIENFEYGNGPIIGSKPPTESSKSWKDNLQRFYCNGTLSDVTIRTPTKEYPAHKAMLCAQSAVFTAMFEREMTEQQTGIIDIGDVKDEAISKMLLYIYGGSVDNLDWSLALDLYFAADKYRIEPLGEKCSDFLKENFSSGNVCECLTLADLHQDQQLKLVAQEYILEHSTDVINSENWKELMKENLSLAAETMHMWFRSFKTT